VLCSRKHLYHEIRDSGSPAQACVQSEIGFGTLRLLTVPAQRLRDRYSQISDSDINFAGGVLQTIFFHLNTYSASNSTPKSTSLRTCSDLLTNAGGGGCRLCRDISNPAASFFMLPECLKARKRRQWAKQASDFASFCEIVEVRTSGAPSDLLSLNTQHKEKEGRCCLTGTL